MRICPACEFMVPETRSNCQNCGVEPDNQDEVRTTRRNVASWAMVGTAAVAVGITAIGVFGQTVETTFEPIYGSSLVVDIPEDGVEP